MGITRLRLLDARTVRALLPMERCVDLMRQAMLLVAQQRTLQPIRSSLWHPNGKGLLSMMPGYTADPEWFGIKVVSVFPGNFGSERGSHQGMVLLFDAEHGSPVAILDGREITAIRTAAATAVATDVLARRDTSTLAILGYGEQARTHLESMRLVRPFKRIVVWGRDLAKAHRFCEQAATQTRSRVEAVRWARAAVEQADVICTTTAAAEPILEGQWLHSGQHLNVVGSSIPATAEIDVEAVRRCRFFVDFKDSALELAGDFRRAREAGAVGEDHLLGSIGDALVGRIAGRTSDQDTTLFKSLGMICEDLVAADFVLRESERRGIGTLVDW
jgi:ornithine cyclodeaminase/alanine dehydrogenase-like protein (mu-crystallin family)